MFCNFLDFFFFLEFTFLGLVGTDRNQFFFLSIFRPVSAWNEARLNLSPVRKEILLERCVLISWIFLLFFLEFSRLGREGTKFGTKFFFSLFLGLSQSSLEWHNAGMMFFNFLNFFAIFFLEFSRPGRVGSVFGTKFFFFSFSAYLNPVWIEIIPEWCFFLVFWNFFWNFLARVG